MSTLKISKHSDVPAALDLVKEEVDKEAKRILSAGGDALKAGKIKPAKEAIAYAEELAEFVGKIQALGEDWLALEAKIGAAAPEVKEIMRLPKAQVKHKSGYTRKVTTVAPKSNFMVRFPDGKLIADAKACRVLARAIEKLGAERVASLEFMVGGEPLVTQNKALLKKMPSATEEIAGRWFVKTHSSTASKIACLTKISAALNVKLKIEEA